jgi:hypothetical protein
VNTSDSKIWGYVAQIDLGNFTVGLATIALAMVTFWIAVGRSRSDGRRQIALLREKWIYVMKENCASFVKTVHSIRNIWVDHALKSSGSSRDQLDADLRIHNASIMQLESFIRMNLNPEEREHRFLMAFMEQSRGLLSHAGLSQPSSGVISVSDLHLEHMEKVCTLIFKKEWARVKAEMRNSSDRKIASTMNSIDLKHAEILEAAQAAFKSVVGKAIE